AVGVHHVLEITPKRALLLAIGVEELGAIGSGEAIGAADGAGDVAGAVGASLEDVEEAKQGDGVLGGGLLDVVDEILGRRQWLDRERVAAEVVKVRGDARLVEATPPGEQA